MVYPTDEETFDNRVSPEFVRDDHLNLIQAFLKRIQDFLGYGGRLNDKTGLVMPVGAIMPYTGLTAPNGWLLCDGKPYPNFGELYEDLYAVIGDKYGATDVSHFRVPDFRGYFLRGWKDIPGGSFVPGDVTTGMDRITVTGAKFNRTGIPVRFTTDGVLPAPFVVDVTYFLTDTTGHVCYFSTTRANAIAGVKIDITTVGVGTSYLHAYMEDDEDTRLKLAPGGNDGADLGSYQEDAEQGHKHGFFFEGYAGNQLLSTQRYFGRKNSDDSLFARVNYSNVNTEIVGTPIADSTHGTPRTASETRSKNVYVNYIIKR